MVKALFVDAQWDGDMHCSEEVLAYLKEKKIKSIAVFAAVNFVHDTTVIEQLQKEGFDVITTKAKRTHVQTQILGCDSYHDSFADPVLNADILLYVGDGMFHPEALLFAQMYNKNPKDVLCWDPVSQKMKIITQENIKKRSLKIKANIMQYLHAKTVGILVTLKPGQQFLELAQAVKKKIEAQGKKAYVFVDNTFEYKRMEDYNFVDVWVNTACPRIGQDDVTVAPKPLINAAEALEPEKALERFP